MNKPCADLQALLPFYAAGTLEESRRRAVEAHLATCAGCRAALALWSATGRAVLAADRKLPAPPLRVLTAALAQVRAEAEERTAAGSPPDLDWAWQLLAMQARLVRREIWFAAAAIIGIGCLLSLSLLAGEAGFLVFVAPLVAAASVAMIYGPDNDPALELALASPTSPRQVLLARLCLVFGYDLALALGGSLALHVAAAGDGALGSADPELAGAHDLSLGAGPGPFGQHRRGQRGDRRLRGLGGPLDGPRPGRREHHRRRRALAGRGRGDRGRVEQHRLAVRPGRRAVCAHPVARRPAAAIWDVRDRRPMGSIALGNTVPIRYHLLAYRKDQLWLPAGMWALFVIMPLLLQGDSAGQAAGAFLAIVLPLMAGILAASCVLDDPALELQLAAPRRARRMLLERLAMLAGILAAAALSYQVVMAAVGIDLAAYGDLARRQILWLVPLACMLGLGSVAGLGAAQSTAGVLAVGVVWILQVLAHGPIMASAWARYLFLFTGFYEPGGAWLAANDLCLAALSVLFTALAWRALENQERYL